MVTEAQVHAFHLARFHHSSEPGPSYHAGPSNSGIPTLVEPVKRTKKDRTTVLIPVKSGNGAVAVAVGGDAPQHLSGDAEWSVADPDPGLAKIRTIPKRLKSISDSRGRGTSIPEPKDQNQEEDRQSMANGMGKRKRIRISESDVHLFHLNHHPLQVQYQPQAAPQVPLPMADAERSQSKPKAKSTTRAVIPKRRTQPHFRDSSDISGAFDHSSEPEEAMSEEDELEVDELIPSSPVTGPSTPTLAVEEKRNSWRQIISAAASPLSRVFASSPPTSIPRVKPLVPLTDLPTPPRPTPITMPGDTPRRAQGTGGLRMTPLALGTGKKRRKGPTWVTQSPVPGK